MNIVAGVHTQQMCQPFKKWFWSNSKTCVAILREREQIIFFFLHVQNHNASCTYYEIFNLQ